MIKILGGRGYSAVGIGILLLGLTGLIVFGMQFFLGMSLLPPQNALTEGRYSVDGGPWKQVNGDGTIPDSFHTLTCILSLPEYSLDTYSNLNISSKNVWYELRDSSGQLLAEHSYQSKQALLDKSYDLYLNAARNIGDSSDPMLDRNYFDENFPIGDAPFMYMPDTPGYKTTVTSIDELVRSGLTENESLTLTVTNPYSASEMRFSECFDITLSGDNGYYLRFFSDVLPVLLVFVLICFFGLFLFPIAGFILGKIDYRYLTFGLLSFFWGLFMIGQRIGNYINLWIYDPTVCMAIEILLNYILIAAILFYLKSNLKNAVPRMLANLTITVFILTSVAAAILHFSHIRDLYATSRYMYIVTAVGVLFLVVLLIHETRKQDFVVRKRSLLFLISWIPLALTILVDAVNHYVYYTRIHFYYFGLAVTMFFQIFRMILDLKRQYKEAIRYQQVQKELYEARVGVMVSQIQPHFMYNALTSIAMMCSIDPDTAKDATITFAKYLRGNMDSLKQTAPVPFEQELEHLKKYLYIEKLRFQDKLNIEYDIQTTAFYLPLLSIQPLVENAVKHGVGMKKKGGTVTIATRETEEAYEVIISDDGVGFDTNAEKPDDGRSHVGMENTKRRLKELCEGEVVIESTVDVGTTTTVVLPKSGQAEPDSDET